MQVSRIALVVSLILASFQLLAHAQGKERSAEYATRYRTMPIDRGGHFAARKEPQFFAEELRAVFKPPH
jgi:hypothetical protein